MQFWRFFFFFFFFLDLNQRISCDATLSEIFSVEYVTVSHGVTVAKITTISRRSFVFFNLSFLCWVKLFQRSDWINFLSL